MQKNIILERTIHSIADTHVCAEELIQHYMYNMTTSASSWYPKKHEDGWSPIFLYGLVGVGKSVFVKHALTLLGADISCFMSPTYVLIQEYHIYEHSIYHADLYRVDAQQESVFHQIDDCSKEGIIFVEWAEKIPNEYIMYSHYRVYMRIIDEHSRKIIISFTN